MFDLAVWYNNDSKTITRVLKDKKGLSQRNKVLLSAISLSSIHA